jgi:hypothetical protein
MLLTIALLGCDLTKVGAYDCSEYCDQVIAKTQECGEQAAHDQCVEAGGTEEECSATSWEDVQAYAGEAREDWADASKDDMIASCEQDIEESGKTDASCEAETATINNVTCDQILDTIETLSSSQ